MKNSKNILYYILIFFIVYIILYFINHYLRNNKEHFSNNMKDYNVIFAGTCKNVDKYIETMLKHIDKCGNKFKSYKLIIYENDSKDNTRDLLIKNKKDNYIYIFENNITEPLRTVRLQNGRNKILDKVHEININDTYQYLIIIDLDDITDCP